MNVCSQMSLSAVVLKSPMRITHLKFLGEWSGWFNQSINRVYFQTKCEQS